MTTLTLRRHRGTYVLEGIAQHGASLRSGWTMRRGEIHAGGGTWAVGVTDFRRHGVVVEAEHGPVIRLHPHRTHVPGPGGPAHWVTGRNHGILTRDTSRISVHQSALPGRPVRIEVTGSWAQLELVVLTACFAVMTRRRRRTLTILAVVGATGHGPVG